MSLEPEQELAFEQYCEDEGDRKLKEFVKLDHFQHPSEKDVLFNPKMVYEQWQLLRGIYQVEEPDECVDTINRWLSEDTDYDIAYGMYLREEWIRETGRP